MMHCINKRHWVLTTFVLSSTIALTSCSRSKSKTEFIDSAQGSWQSGCQNYGINSEYGQVTLEVADTTVELTNTFFEDPRCIRPTMTFRSGGSLLKHDRLQSQDDQQFANIDFIIEQVSAEVLSEAKRAQFNSNATCELSNWAIGVNVDVSNCVDIAQSTVPRTEYDIYSTTTKINAAGVSTDVLYTGMVRGSTEDDRPSAPDLQNPYWRIDTNASE